MSTTIKQRLATLITTVIFAYILFRVLDRLFIVIWVQVPWWGLIIAAVVLYLVIDHLVHRLLK
ncbi:MAG: hypothetical protein DYG89_19775 [Caldilinea sp. CFX5]|nr:hypothetical protein [Caldilinea sp. CFX5]